MEKIRYRGLQVKKRQIKKNSKTAMRYLLEMHHYYISDFEKADTYDSARHKVPKNTVLYQYQISYEYQEYESKTAYDELCEVVFSSLPGFDCLLDEECCNHAPNPITAKKVFDLARRLILEACQ